MQGVSYTINMVAVDSSWVGGIDDWPKPQVEILRDVHYLHGLFPKEFLEVRFLKRTETCRVVGNPHVQASGGNTLVWVVLGHTIHRAVFVKARL